ncbi:MAG: nickel pincer cofactor biosynthesis protein LarC [Dehalococcoidia bacterium]|nr:nickel pincer cofactor biosynthesis protein LarC [Dehalococcoidia bacterium]
MRIAWLQCANGVSGDMLLGALVDAGAPMDAMNEAIDCVFPDEPIRLTPVETSRAGIRATHIAVQGGDTAEHGHTSLRDLIDRVEKANLPASVIQRAIAILRRIGEAEARVHGGSAESVELAELGSADTLVDIVGTLVGLGELGIETLYSTGLPLATGRVTTQHGTLPVPAPGALEIMRLAGAPALPPPANAEGQQTGELVTPTGAAIVTTLASFDPPPVMNTVDAVGYGAGTKDPKGRANIVTLVVGEAAAEPTQTRAMAMIETTIDDMNPEVYDYVRERLMATGARDVWLENVQMKKGRPGVIVSAIAPESVKDAIVRELLRETTTLGVRVTPMTRYEAVRESVIVQTPLGPASVKIKRLVEGGEIIGISPEYEDCRQLAKQSSVPLSRVYDIVRRAAEDSLR